jgi:hypothetical protein
VLVVLVFVVVNATLTSLCLRDAKLVCALPRTPAGGGWVMGGGWVL